MKILIIGETGTGKTVTSLSISKFFRTLYYDVDLGTGLWLKSLQVNEKKVRIIKIRTWEEYKEKNIQKLSITKPDMIVIDSLSELFEKYKDYVKGYVKKTGKFPMPVATGVVDLLRKGIDPEFITLPMPMYTLVYETIADIVRDAVSYSEHTIITMHPMETRVVAQLADGTSEVVHSSGKLSFLQKIYRNMDVILKLKKPMQAQVIKSRGDLKVPKELVNPVEFLKEKLGINNET